jgi:hypothetical protein
VVGQLPSRIAKPAPVTADEFIVSGAVPVEVSVSDCVVAASTVTPPKFNLATLNVNCGLGTAVLAPLKATTDISPLDELLPMMICPLVVPVALGLNRT